jgi:hypothetical protein
MPPEPWNLEADDEPFFRSLGELIATGLSRGNELTDLTLSAANVTVDASAGGELPVGDLVAVTIRGRGDWSPERTWRPGRGDDPTPFVSSDLEQALAASGAVHAYARQTAPDEGSITVFFERSV